MSDPLATASASAAGQGVCRFTAWKRAAAVVGSMIALAGCATQPQRQASLGGSHFDPRLGVTSSQRVVFGDDPVPRGGGSYLVGRPYVIAGHSYYPSQRPQGYTAVGTASWYGDAFHGRRTANGEVFDRGSISAAHPTLPLPSYVRVTNLGNNRSIIVRVNDRGPYHGGRVMDVSQKVAETLDFRRAGTARIKIDYIGRAALSGSDDEKLLATLRTDGAPAQMAGFADEGAVASAASDTPAPPSPPPQPPRVARLTRTEDPAPPQPDAKPAHEPVGRPTKAPLPPVRPFDMSEAARTTPAVLRPSRAARVATLLQQR